MESSINHAEMEKRCIELWEKELVYKFDPGAKGEIYSVDTPPPTVSGRIHIGHAFSYNHMDIMARYKKLRGYNVFYPWGFDDNGLPTERFVERERGIIASYPLKLSKIKKKKKIEYFLGCYLLKAVE